MEEITTLTYQLPPTATSIDTTTPFSNQNTEYDENELFGLKGDSTEKAINDLEEWIKCMNLTIALKKNLPKVQDVNKVAYVCYFALAFNVTDSQEVGAFPVTIDRIELEKWIEESRVHQRFEFYLLIGFLCNCLTLGVILSLDIYSCCKESKKYKVVPTRFTTYELVNKDEP
jgi:hypothetical protein